LKAQDGEKGMSSYEEPLVTIEMLDLLGMPRREDILKFFKEMSEDISEYEHKASHSSYYCYVDMADALRRIYEKERTAYRPYI